MSRGKKKPSLSDLSKEKLKFYDHPAARKELFEGTDRSAALVGAALVDSSIVNALRAHFVEMKEDEFENLFYGRNAVLSTLAGRTKIAFAMGIFGTQARDMIDSVRRIRNAFAHSARPLEFSHPLIEKECHGLPAATLKQLFLKPPQGVQKYKERYISACLNLVIILDDHAERFSGREVVIDIPNGSGVSPPTSLGKS